MYGHAQSAEVCGGKLKSSKTICASGHGSPPAAFIEKEPVRPPDVAAIERGFLLSIGWPSQIIDRLAAEAAACGSGPIELGIARGWLKASDFYEDLSRKLCFSREKNNSSRLILPFSPSRAWLLLQRPMALPLAYDNCAALNAQTFSLTELLNLAERLGPRRSRVKLLTRQTLIDAVTKAYGHALVSRAAMLLPSTQPDFSAKTGLRPWQAILVAAAAGLFLGAFALAPQEAVTLAAFLLSIFFLFAIALRFAAAFNLLARGKETEGADAPALADAELPRYSIIVPLFREVEILPHLARSLRAIDYPPAKLDIKIVLESIDRETIEAARRLPFPGNVDFIIVPDYGPRTKPKALNYALHFATGDLAVVFDAEDRPEPDQLRKAAAVFHRGPPRLDYFNASENWLSRQFTIEYASLFRGLLPFLSRFGLPVPLGGTSNHFRIDVLRELGAWDPFNVTEDADLGMRLHRAGYSIGMLDSTTFEEACCHTKAWVRQRTRWLKGWMQTFAVHMRSPLRALRETGLFGFLAFHAYFAGIILSALAHPFFYLVLMHDALSGNLFEARTFAGRAMLGLSLAIFIGGYLANIMLGLLSLRRTRHGGLARHALHIPLYWLLISAAAYRAVFQLIRKPFLWEKTAHGVSSRLAGGP